MLNKLLAFSREYAMITPGDHIICAVSGGADSIALLFGLYLLREKLGITLCAAHFNHGLRGSESDRDEQFVRDFCGRYDIKLYVGSSTVVPGKKGLEAAARDARYAFLRSLPGKIATAHTADDNAETLLLHLLRGSSLKGLGGITPISDNLIRPMLCITRRQVEAFLTEWSLSHIEDSSNSGDAFLRNRLRHHVMPLLTAENPALCENLSAMALRLREDEAFIESTLPTALPGISQMRNMNRAQRCRLLSRFLKQSGIPEPESTHIGLAEKLVFSAQPSAQAVFPGGIVIARCYDTLTVMHPSEPPEPMCLPCPGSAVFGEYTITCTEATAAENTPDTFTILPKGALTVRSRASGDRIRLGGGSKDLKKIFIDRKFPAAERPFIPVICDEEGLLGVYRIGVHLDRAAQSLPAVRIHIEKTNGGKA